MRSFHIHSDYLSVGKFKLGYQIEGSGPPVLVIGSAIYYPRTFSQSLRQHLRLIFVDHRGFGTQLKSIEPTHYTLDVILSDIELIRQTLNLNRIIVVGHSGHGYLALEYAKKYPDAVSEVVLLAMSPDSSPQSFAAADQYFQESVCPIRKALLAKNLSTLQIEIKANPSQAFITRSLKYGPMIWYDEHFDAKKLWQGVKVIPEIMDYLSGDVFRNIDIKQGLENFNRPVFLGLGRYDYWNPPYLWQMVRPYFKSLHIRVFEKSGHTPQYEEPVLFDMELLQWISHHSKRK